MTVLGFHLPHSVSFWLQGSNVSLVLSACLNLPGASWVIGILTVTHFTEHRGFFRTRLSSLFIKLLNCLASNNFYCLLQPITVKRLQQPLPLLHNTTPIITISGTVASILLLLYCCKACHHYYWECFFFQIVNSDCAFHYNHSCHCFYYLYAFLMHQDELFFQIFAPTMTK